MRLPGPIRGGSPRRTGACTGPSGHPGCRPGACGQSRRLRSRRCSRRGTGRRCSTLSRLHCLPMPPRRQGALHPGHRGCGSGLRASASGPTTKPRAVPAEPFLLSPSCRQSRPPGEWPCTGPAAPRWVSASPRGVAGVSWAGPSFALPLHGRVQGLPHPPRQVLPAPVRRRPAGSLLLLRHGDLHTIVAGAGCTTRMPWRLGPGRRPLPGPAGTRASARPRHLPPTSGRRSAAPC